MGTCGWTKIVEAVGPHFYERVFTSMHVPTRPTRGKFRLRIRPEREVKKPRAHAEIIHVDMLARHLAADTDLLACTAACAASRPGHRVLRPERGTWTAPSPPAASAGLR